MSQSSTQRRTHVHTHVPVPNMFKLTDGSRPRIPTQACGPFLVLAPDSIPAHKGPPARVPETEVLMSQLCLFPQTAILWSPSGPKVHPCGIRSDLGEADQGKRFKQILAVSLKPLGQGILGCLKPIWKEEPDGHIGPPTPVQEQGTA